MLTTSYSYTVVYFKNQLILNRLPSPPSNPALSSRRPDFLLPLLPPPLPYGKHAHLLDLLVRINSPPVSERVLFLRVVALLIKLTDSNADWGTELDGLLQLTSTILLLPDLPISQQDANVLNACILNYIFKIHTTRMYTTQTSGAK